MNNKIKAGLILFAMLFACAAAGVLLLAIAVWIAHHIAPVILDFCAIVVIVYLYVIWRVIYEGLEEKR